MSAARKDDVQGNGALACLLLTLWAWGEMSPQLLQRIAKAAVTDFDSEDADSMKDLRALAEIGTNGTYANKAHSDLMQKVAHTSRLPAPLKFRLPFKKPLGLCLQGILLPHEMLAALYSEYRHAFLETICSSIQTLKKFWAGASQHPTMDRHPAKRVPGWTSLFIPLAVHDDGVPITGIGKGWSKSMTIFGWYSLVGLGKTKSMLHYCWGFYDKLKKGDLEEGTLSDFFKILKWSLLAMYEGQWPRADYNGKVYKVGTPEHSRAGRNLAGGYRCLLFGLTGDLDYFHYILGCMNWSLSRGPCMWCQCKATGDNSWSDFGANAEWRLTRWDKAAWHGWQERTKLALLTLPGCSNFTIMYDWMHCKYLGFDMYCFGSVLALLVNFVLMDSPENNLVQCWNFLKQYFKDHNTPTPFRYINKLTMFIRQGKYPKLRGKAREVRCLGPALCALWQQDASRNLHVHREVTAMMKCNVHLEEMLTEYRDEYVLPAGASSEFEATCEKVLQLYNSLAQHFLEEEMRLFDVTSKAHFMQEIALMAKYISPRLTWAFMGEDQMQKMSRVAKSCTSGNVITGQTIKMAEHYRIGFHLVLEEMRVFD